MATEDKELMVTVEVYRLEKSNELHADFLGPDGFSAFEWKRKMLEGEDSGSLTLFISEAAKNYSAFLKQMPDSLSVSKK
jgi:hypothetical protein